ncbi:SpoOM protein [Micromonospora viridifaciens]|uniref:SpoOM protein n=1 Tax=Micromonospora viridifaciens TaxID=1881 RepID=A0A1C4YBH0_MICVI|nr:SpoOM protein [Micromonospora viridifaciens]
MEGVDTVLSNPNTRPGLALGGQVNLVGGSHDVQIDQITVGLVTRVEMQGAGEEYDGFVEFHRVGVAGGLLLREGQHLSLPFQLAMPWETPVTSLYGQHLHGMTMGLRTEVAIRGAVDKGDLDPVYVHPLPVQERILEAFGRLGFQFKGADLERGHIYGLHQSLPLRPLPGHPRRLRPGRLGRPLGHLGPPGPGPVPQPARRPWIRPAHPRVRHAGWLPAASAAAWLRARRLRGAWLRPSGWPLQGGAPPRAAPAWAASPRAWSAAQHSASPAA